MSRALTMSMIDLDVVLYVEYNNKTKMPIALIETAIDVNQSHKSGTVTANLAKMSNLPCFVVLYKLSGNDNPASKSVKDIQSFRLKQLYPTKFDDWIELTPSEYVGFLSCLREKW